MEFMILRYWRKQNNIVNLKEELNNILEEHSKESKIGR